MSESSEILHSLINDFSLEKVIRFFRTKSENFRIHRTDLSFLNDDNFTHCSQIGELELPDGILILVASFKVLKQLTERSGKKSQYELAKKILKQEQRYTAGFFIFYDHNGNFRLSLIYDIPKPNVKREWSNFRRFTYYVTPNKPNKTFRLQLDKADFTSLNSIQKAFSLEAVTDDFYKEFKPNFDKLAESIIEPQYQSSKQDFALLFIIRTIFLGFVQKKLWLNSDEDFIQNFWYEYKSKYYNKNSFYGEWLQPLFFESLNNPPGRKVFNGTTPFLEKTSLALQMAPYLNGELFKEKTGVDDQDLSIPDKAIEQFFDFLFSYNFTIEENTLYDQELELNPEFLGIIFERLVNKEDGAVYTPRTEVGFMCRISLVKWLQKTSNVNKKKLYHLFFDEHNNSGNEQDIASLTISEKENILSLLKNITVCDPASGSGAFTVGMLQVLDEIIQLLSSSNNRNAFERKKEIISRSLYGVEVKSWAVWINQLRLWLSLFIDMPDELNKSFEPLLPNLEFKIRRGDSLVQKIGSKIFPVESHANLSPQLKRKITELKKEKTDFFFGRNKLNAGLIKKKESGIFKEILEEEIIEKKRNLKLFGHIESNLDIFGVVTKKEELRLQMDAKKKEQLIEEIKNLEEELKSFKDDHPLVWNIEFAEIFYDKNGFDIIIGNPPYVRNEEIVDPDKKLSPNDYKEQLRLTIYEEFPYHFYSKSDKSKLKNKIDGKSDLYTFFYLKSLKLLNENGVHTFICSNSWLDVGYGKWLQQFILDNAKLHFVIDNQSKRSFSSSDVNTIITVLDSPKNYEDELHKVKFIVFKRPFEEILNTENLLLNEYAETITKDDDFRVYPITYKELQEAGTVYENENDKKLGKGTYEGDKWGGKYLRAPDIFYKLQEKYSSGELISIEPKIGTIKTISWSRLGLNSEIMIPKDNISVKHKNLYPVLKSPREINSIIFSKENTKHFLIVNDNIKRKLVTSKVLWVDIRGEKHLCLFNSDNVFFTHNFHGIDINNDYEPWLITALLSSTIVWLVIEVVGRRGLGGGAVRILTVDLKRTALLLNPKILTAKQIDSIKNLFFSKIGIRNTQVVFTECGIDPTKSIRSQKPNPFSDRKALDDIIFDALGLPKPEREEVYYSVCELVQNRLNKAKSV